MLLQARLQPVAVDILGSRRSRPLRYVVPSLRRIYMRRRTASHLQQPEFQSMAEEADVGSAGGTHGSPIQSVNLEQLSTSKSIGEF